MRVSAFAPSGLDVISERSNIAIDPSEYKHAMGTIIDLNCHQRVLTRHRGRPRRTELSRLLGAGCDVQRGRALLLAAGRGAPFRPSGDWHLPH